VREMSESSSLPKKREGAHTRTYTFVHTHTHTHTYAYILYTHPHHTNLFTGVLAKSLVKAFSKGGILFLGLYHSDVDISRGDRERQHSR
jgi:hypothetical protein